MLVMKISTKGEEMIPFIQRLFSFWKNLFKERSANSRRLTDAQKEYYVIENKNESVPFI